MADFTGTDSNETITPLFVSRTVTATGGTLPSDAPDFIDGGAGNDTIDGGGGADVLIGGDGNDVVTGGRGNDVAFLGSGDDRFIWNPGDGSDVVEGQAGFDTLDFVGANVDEKISVSANGSRATVFRDFGNVTMDIDRVERIQVEAAGGADNILVNDLTGTDVKQVAIDLAASGTTIGDGQPDIVTVNGAAGTDHISVSSSGASVVVDGLSAQVTIDVAEAANDAVIVNGLGGNDTIDASALNAGQINLVIDGGAGNDTITGSAGNDLLIGGDGNDTIVGGRGSDVALMGNGNDRFVWNPGDGSDIVEGQAGFDTLEFNGSDVKETIKVAANGQRVLLTRDVGNVTMDVAGVETFVISAKGGDDTIDASALPAGSTQLVVDGGTGNDTIVGSAGNDGLGGGDGNDTIVGGRGSDVALLGDGNDRFIWNPGDGSDVVEGQAGFDALDFVGANVDENISISANGRRATLFRDVGNVTMNLDGVERIRVAALGGADNIVVNDLTGTDVKQVAIDLAASGTTVGDGQPDSVTVNGTAGNDQISVTASGTVITVGGLSEQVTIDHADAGDRLSINGGAGNDTITASTLPAGTMALTLDGGAGNDLYIVNNAGDVVNEAAGQGTDRVATSVSYRLGAGQSIEVLTPTSFHTTTDIDLTGNALAQRIFGNAGNNVINDGGAGAADTMSGLGGNDTYIVNNSGDVVTEAAAGGNDRVATSVSYTLGAGQSIEMLTPTSFASTTNIDFDGNALAQAIIGNAGNNVIDGKGGNDTLTGGSGNDTFRFDTALDTATNDPRITDFTVGHDMIELSHAIFTALSPGALSSDAFFVGGAAHDASDRVIYNAGTGALSYDADGNGAGAAVQFAKLSTDLTTLSASQFQVTP